MERVYEDFEPSTEWVHEPTLDILHIYLPGFTKEQIKVQVTSAKNLRITGERQHQDKISRFRKEFPLPAGADMNKISANFSGGTLYVKLAKSGSRAEIQIDKEKSTKTNGAKPGEKETQKFTPTESKQPQASKQEELKQEVAKAEKKPEKAEASNEVGKSDAPKIPEVNKEKQQESEEAHKEKIPEKCDAKTNEKGKLPTGAGAKSRFDDYKKVMSGLVKDYKQPRKAVNLILAVSFLVVIGLYAKNWIGSITKPESLSFTKPEN